MECTYPEDAFCCTVSLSGYRNDNERTDATNVKTSAPASGNRDWRAETGDQVQQERSRGAYLFQMPPAEQRGHRGNRAPMCQFGLQNTSNRRHSDRWFALP